MVETELKTTGIPRIGDIAPLFQAPTTMGSIKLDDFRGKWLVFFSHPADFTPVGTTEFIALARLQPEFKKRGAELLGLSVDSLPSHIAWVRNIEEKTGVRINFPLAADPDRYIATLYGMIHPEQSRSFTVRCVFIIDPKQTVRAVIYYPSNIGRNTTEILRLLDALQATDQLGIETPADWKPGDLVIVPEPLTQEEAEKRVKEKYDCTDWYLCKKKPD